jgi:carnitine operon protein CaiE
MNAVVMDGAIIGEDSIVAAGSFVKAGFKGASRQLLVGSPAKVIREVSEQDLHWKGLNTKEYQALVWRSAASMNVVSPLLEMEADRPRLKGVTVVQPKV